MTGGSHPPRRSARLSSERRATCLVVDDESSIAELVGRTLTVSGFQVATTGSVAGALALADELRPEIAILDVMLPDGSGFDLCHRLRDLLPDLGVIFLSARDSVDDRLTGLTLGGDDYVTKPFSVAEVVARVNVLLRRIGPPAAPALLAVGDVEMDEDAHQVRRAGEPIELSPTEFRLLRLFLENQNRVLSKQQILSQVWDYDFLGDGGVVEKFVSQLRRKLDEGRDPMLHTVRGFGYVLRPPGSR